MALIVGLTGGIASGKTTVANIFRDQFSIDIVDADVVAREVVEPGSDGLKAIVARYGQEVLHSDGTLNRPALRTIIFAHPSEKQWIDALLHPMIRRNMQQQLQHVTSEYALLVIPLMVENDLQQLADLVLVVDVEEEIQIQRTMNRDGVSRQQAESILQSQASREQRLAIANDVIKNHSQNQQLLPQITELHKKYLEMCRANL
ncbi:dephospho-CoA kinase [Vibrio panuliri]|uniref:Dephospho-CoA kinase n=1 Tax=Vibrio panuliri TaxID=1381081 RepID=A0A1Q9HLB5_9VIBR|nr:dephospho-CoA kinase [Vibrio panuliri]KAB1459725.1 dephospho-CoA kinase [Vibrio panuliri]OLQ90051.1 dephospho-CoA kinase [Vibrio panuliri]OLQ91258.1 dephospho-CoA kinase [Vibrio panuliri]